MDKAVAKHAIERIEAEKAIHGTKFAGRAEHANCPERFDKVLAKLYADMESAPRVDSTNSLGALPDAIASAKQMEEVADALAKDNKKDAAAHLKREAEKVVFKELNEMDGFDR